MKKSVYYVAVALTTMALLIPASTIFADEEEGDWKDMKQESKRMKLDETAEEALQALFTENAKAKELYDGSYGWAVFDNLKLAFGFSGGGGNGVAKARVSGEKGWQAEATASAVAGETGAEAKTDFSNGMAIYQITDTGLMAFADIAGTKYWKNKKLNR